MNVLKRVILPHQQASVWRCCQKLSECPAMLFLQSENNSQHISCNVRRYKTPIVQKEKSTGNGKNVRISPESTTEGREPTSLLVEMMYSRPSTHGQARLSDISEVSYMPASKAYGTGDASIAKDYTRYPEMENLLRDKQLSAKELASLPLEEEDDDDWMNEEQGWSDGESDEESDYSDIEEAEEEKMLENFVKKKDGGVEREENCPALVSDVPCSGCGAFLHCQDRSLPGYMPRKAFESVPPNRLRDKLCERCRYLRQYTIALNVSMKPSDYRDIIKHIQRKHALVIAVVDVTDLPNSIMKELPQLIGEKRPLYIIGNKVDLLPQDSKDYLKRIHQTLIDQCEQAGLLTNMYLKHVSLVSAKTGYGIENLVSHLIKHWARNGDVFMVGCTNVGKSSLFNALLSSDYCQSLAKDFIHNATISKWPGTTLNLLKFPIVDPTPSRMRQRYLRLREERLLQREAEKARKEKLKSTGKIVYATLQGHVGKTFATKTEVIREQMSETPAISPMFSFQEKTGMAVHDEESHKRAQEKFEKEVGEYEMEKYARWCHDTPGLVNPEQIINLLTEEELKYVLPDRMIRPRSYRVKPGHVMFMSGLGRLDYVSGPESVLMTVFANCHVPVHVIRYNEADDFYAKYCGTEVLMVPCGSQDRLDRLPSLVGQQMLVQGAGWTYSAADIVLSSLGWVAVTMGEEMEITLRAYTPGRLGCLLRQPSLLPYSVNQRGRRLSKSAAYAVPKASVWDTMTLLRQKKSSVSNKT